MANADFFAKALVGISGQFADGSEVVARAGRYSDLLATPLRGSYSELTRQGKVFFFSQAAVTLPVNAATLASKFGVYNPPGSGVYLEILEIDAHAVVATTVVDALGVYYSNGTNASGSTFTTQGTVESGRPGDGFASQARGYSAVTHVGTPVLTDLVGGWGAVTDGGSTEVYKRYNGELQIPPGVLVSLAMTTAASTGSGITLGMRWAELAI